MTLNAINIKTKPSFPELHIELRKLINHAMISDLPQEMAAELLKCINDLNNLIRKIEKGQFNKLPPIPEEQGHKHGLD